MNRLIAVALLVLLPSIALAQSDDLRRARAAAESEDWTTALQYLESAKQAGPPTKDVFYLLGAGPARIPGHEIPALIYVRASIAPKEKVGADMERSLTDLETKIRARSNELFKQSIAVLELLPPADRERVAPKIVEAAARAGRPEFARQAALTSVRGTGTTAAVFGIAMKRLEDGRVNDASLLFDLAAEMTANDVWTNVPRAIPAIGRPPPPADPVERQAYDEKWAEIDRRANEEEASAALASNRTFSGAAGLMNLGILEYANGFKAKGYKHFHDGEMRWRGMGGMGPVNATPTLSPWLGKTELMCFGTCEVRDGIKPASGGADRAAATGEPHVAWKTVAAGEAAVNPADTDLSDLVTAVTRISTNTDPAGAAIETADLAARIAEASWFLEKNRP